MSEPSLLFWNSLGAKPKSDNMEKALLAEIRDPLWLLCRQWQFGEFKAEDAAAPVFARIHYKQSFPAWVSGRDGEKIPAPEKQPLNHWVETAPAALDLSARIEIGQQWLRLLDQEYIAGDKTVVQEAFSGHERLVFRAPPGTDRLEKYQHAELLSNTGLSDMLEILQYREAIDGEKLLLLISQDSPAFSEVILGAPNLSLDALGLQLLNWAQRIYSYRIPDQHTWHEAHLEHQFSVGLTESANSQLHLKAREYSGDKLDWFQFDAESGDLPAEDPQTTVIEKVAVQMPVQVNYTGMPKTRWWEMEDATVNFGNIKTDTTNPARLLFVQFNLVYGNDWFMLPLEVAIGSLTRVESILVKDNFGLHTKISPTPAAAKGKWGFFQFHTENEEDLLESRYFYPPAAGDFQQSPVMEQVNFIRDEMANMVWGIEEIVPDGVSTGVRGREKAGALREYVSRLEAPDAYTALANQAELKYLLSSRVPENWIPFIPVRVGDHASSRQVQLQRASMPRLAQGLPVQRIRPQTAFLRQGISEDGIRPYLLFEEEVPRAGAIVKGYWKRARWINGETFVWYARQKTVGRGEDTSQLQFDFLKPVSQ